MHPADVNLYLVGFMGTGKSTVGRAVAARLGFQLVDSDQEIERIASVLLAAKKIAIVAGEGAQASGAGPELLAVAEALITLVEEHRPALDAMLERLAPAFPLSSMTHIDRTILRTGLGEVLHSRAAAPAEAIAAWTALARTYSGEPARKLVGGVLGTAHREASTAKAETDGGSER